MECLGPPGSNGRHSISPVNEVRYSITLRTLKTPRRIFLEEFERYHVLLRHQLSTVYPRAPAITEDSIMAILDCSINSASSNASSVMKMDIVKPIPPSNPTPS